MSEPTSELTTEQEATWFAYMRVALRLNYEINRELLVDSDLSHQDFHVLNALAHSPGQRLQLTDLAVRIGWERSRVSHQVLRMEARGLVDRRPSSADARATDAVLTRQGADALRRATPGHAALVKQLFFDGLDPVLLKPLHTALDQIHEQILARDTLPRPQGSQSRWTSTGEGCRVVMVMHDAGDRGAALPRGCHRGPGPVCPRRRHRRAPAPGGPAAVRRGRGAASRQPVAPCSGLGELPVLPVRISLVGRRPGPHSQGRPSKAPKAVWVLVLTAATQFVLQLDGCTPGVNA